MENRHRIMLYFGSFNPIHRGHTEVAQYVTDNDFCDELWFVVSPANPLKDSATLINEGHRVIMTEIAAELTCRDIYMCDIELSMPRPSYTIDTLNKIREEYPKYEFSILMGEDNIFDFERWREWKKIASLYNIYIYPRSCKQITSINEKLDYLVREGGLDKSRFNILCDAQLINISSSEIRDKIREGDIGVDILHNEVEQYIKENKLYE